MSFIRRLTGFAVPTALVAVAALAWIQATPAFAVDCLTAFTLLTWCAWLAALRQLEAANARGDAAIELLRKVRDER